MKIFAIIESGKVINIIAWDGTTKFDLKQGQQSVDITNLKDVTIGSTYDGVSFTPPIYVEPVKTQEDVISEAVASQAQAIDDSTTRISALEQQVLDIQTILSKNGIK